MAYLLCQSHSQSLTVDRRGPNESSTAIPTDLWISAVDARDMQAVMAPKQTVDLSIK